MYCWSLKPTANPLVMVKVKELNWYRCQELVCEGGPLTKILSHCFPLPKVLLVFVKISWFSQSFPKYYRVFQGFNLSGGNLRLAMNKTKVKECKILLRVQEASSVYQQNWNQCRQAISFKSTENGDRWDSSRNLHSSRKLRKKAFFAMSLLPFSGNMS